MSRADSFDLTEVKCPACHTSCVRRLEGQCAVCQRCSEIQRRVYRFCVGCQREWPSSCSIGDACTLSNCALRSALLSTRRITSRCSVQNCPYFRACPCCKALLTHTGEGCPNIVCPECHTRLCFRCLRQNCPGFYLRGFMRPDHTLEQCTIVDNRRCLIDLGL